MRYAIALFGLAALLTGCYGDKPLDNPLDPAGDYFKSSDCGSLRCNGHGECVVEEGLLTCECATGYVGDSCDDCDGDYYFVGGLCIKKQPCEEDSCSGHGYCNNDTGYIVCTCDTGYSGEVCDDCELGYWPYNGECRKIESCDDDSCNSHGLCDDTDGFVLCSCDDGYIGDYCDQCDTGYEKSGEFCVEDCGNGLKTIGEECDLGSDNGDCSTCTAECKSKDVNTCGDGFICGTEQCDDHDDNGKYNKCKTDCTGIGPHCGDGTVDSGDEVCEAGLPTDCSVALGTTATGTVLCNETCSGYVWGINCTRLFPCPGKPTTGTVWNSVSGYEQTWSGSAWIPTDDETTEYNAAAHSTECRYACDTVSGYVWDGTILKCAKCGDGNPEGVEACDLGIDNGNCSTCTALCTIKPANFCGDGFICDTEDCDDGEDNGEYDKCVIGCTGHGPYCGDTNVDTPNELCDGNTALCIDVSPILYTSGNVSCAESCFAWNRASCVGTARVTKQWGTSNHDPGKSVVVDKEGNIFVTGYTQGSLDGNTNAGGLDIFLSKWGADGTKAWTKQWGTPGEESGQSVAVDGEGNIFVAGYTMGGLDGNTSAGNYDIFLTKWNADGTKAWTKQRGTSEVENGRSVAVDGEGNIFVAGYTHGSFDGNTSAGSADIFLTKWGADGTRAWTKQWGTSSYDYGSSVAVDGEGNIFVTGHTMEGLDGNANAGGLDIFLTKRSADGTKAWTKQWGTPGEESGQSVAVDGGGNIFVAGYTMGGLDENTNAGGSDIFLTKWNADGTKAWTKQGGTSEEEKGYSVAVDGEGNIFVTGYTHGSFDGNTSAGNYDIFLVKWNADGTKAWTKQWGTPSHDYGNFVAVDGEGSIFVTGDTYGALDGNTYAGGMDVFFSVMAGE